MLLNQGHLLIIEPVTIVSESLEATKFMGFTLTDQSAGFLEIDSFTKIGFIVVLKTGLRQTSGFKLIIECTYATLFTVTLCCTKYYSL